MPPASQRLQVPPHALAAIATAESSTVQCTTENRLKLVAAPIKPKTSERSAVPTRRTAPGSRYATTPRRPTGVPLPAAPASTHHCNRLEAPRSSRHPATCKTERHTPKVPSPVPTTGKSAHDLEGIGPDPLRRRQIHGQDRRAGIRHAAPDVAQNGPAAEKQEHRGRQSDGRPAQSGRPRGRQSDQRQANREGDARQRAGHQADKQCAGQEQAHEQDHEAPLPPFAEPSPQPFAASPRCKELERDRQRQRHSERAERQVLNQRPHQAPEQERPVGDERCPGRVPRRPAGEARVRRTRSVRSRQQVVDRRTPEWARPGLEEAEEPPTWQPTCTSANAVLRKNPAMIAPQTT